MRALGPCPICIKDPSPHAVARQLRALHAAWVHPDAGGEYVSLYLVDDLSWHVETPHDVGCEGYGREYVPGDGQAFDALAAARRLCSDAREERKTLKLGAALPY